jgi:Flp pilus assembly protein TadG
MRIRDGESGQVLVMSALSMTLLLGFMALAIDGGLLFRARRNMQIAADAAAAAAAVDYKYNNSIASAKTAAQTAATGNAVTSTTYVTVNDPPVNGYHKTIGYTEVIISQPVQTAFMGMFGFKNVNIAARAVVGSGVNAGCIWTLARSGNDVSLTGSGAITAQNCDIYDDSSASNALTLTGSGSISAKAIGIVGSYDKTGSGSITPNPPTTGIAPAADPLASLPAPTISTGTCSSSCTPSNTGSGNLTVQPGTYTSISNTGSGTLTLAAGNYVITGSLTNTGSGALILGAGNYSIGGNFTTTGSGAVTLGTDSSFTVGGNLSLTGSGALTGTGETFYTEGGTTLTGSGNMNLTAPTSGPYNGVLVFQARSDTDAMSITGSGGDTIKGIVYAPAAALTLTGSGSMSVSLDMIVDSLSVTGSGSVTDTNYSVVTNADSVLSKLVLVE